MSYTGDIDNQRLLGPSFFEKVKESCSARKVIVAFTIITGLAVAIIGALALVGIHYPHTTLASLGNSIGLEGSISMVALGTTGAGVIKFIDWAIDRRSKFTYQSVS